MLLPTDSTVLKHGDDNKNDCNNNHDNDKDNQNYDNNNDNDDNNSNNNHHANENHIMLDNNLMPTETIPRYADHPKVPCKASGVGNMPLLKLS